MAREVHRAIMAVGETVTRPGQHNLIVHNPSGMIQFSRLTMPPKYSLAECTMDFHMEL